MNKHRLNMKNKTLNGNQGPFNGIPLPIGHLSYVDFNYPPEPDMIPYGTICSCNPANGGSGICGCINGNKMVPNPKKNVKIVDNYTISTNVTTMVNNVNQYDELFELFDFLQEEAKNKRLLAEKSNDPNYYYGMVSAYLDIQSRILKTINKK